MHFPVVHPRTLTDEDEGQNGRSQVSFILHPFNNITNSCEQYSVLMITLGQVIAYAIGAGFFHIKSGWRWMVGLGAVPAGIQFILLFFLPESRAFIIYFPAPMSHTYTYSYTPQPASSCTKEISLVLETSCTRFTPTPNPKTSTSRYPLHFSPHLPLINTYPTHHPSLFILNFSPDQSSQRSRSTIHSHNPNHHFLRPLQVHAPGPH